MRLSYFAFAIFSLILTACSSKPVSYLPSKSDPIVNIEANIAPSIELEVKSDTFSVKNLTETPLTVAYKLFWYDKDGVTQTFDNATARTPWQNIWLEPKQKQTLGLVKPTEESVNYRLYLKSPR